MVFAVAEGHRAQAVAHAPVGHHPPGDIHGAVEIVFGPALNSLKMIFSAAAAAHRDQQDRVQLAFPDVDAVLVRQN